MNNINSEHTKNKQLRFLNRASSKLSTGDTLALFAVGTFGLHLITFFILILIYGSYSQLNKKPVPTLVQLETGSAIKVAPLGNRDRTDVVISRFVSDTMTLMMNWSSSNSQYSLSREASYAIRNSQLILVKDCDNKVQNSNCIDTGINIGERGLRGSKVTSGAWQASYALSEDFRKEFLKMLASMTPTGVFKGTTQVILVPLSIQSPIKIEEGKWKVKIIANLTVFDRGNNLGEVIPFNKEIFVRAVEAPESPANVGELAAVIYQVRASGLEIYAIRDLLQENL
ncbi:hypothetical protein [Calothrix sp. 336/3]|uniref:hypothetical protein n=1 Tax=Calothrix sp. 336/3 TaxID=1337936 RepID=UPI0004E3FFAF|nr:hypothetical protein [Calothrix sp. 336/3]AKG21347.1 hypothetical protein IJ00_08585 [Calothrix sp. 336/3]